MATADASTNQSSHQPTEFENRRAELVSQIGDSLEQVLTQINALNRSMESIIEIGNEFASVEALWSQFETVMGANQQDQQQQQQQQQQQHSQQQSQQHQTQQGSDIARIHGDRQDGQIDGQRS